MSQNDIVVGGFVRKELQQGIKKEMFNFRFCSLNKPCYLTVGDSFNDPLFKQPNNYFKMKIFLSGYKLDSLFRKSSFKFLK